jgi:hypothetical protein
MNEKMKTARPEQEIQKISYECWGWGVLPSGGLLPNLLHSVVIFENQFDFVQSGERKRTIRVFNRVPLFSTMPLPSSVAVISPSNLALFQ